MRIGFVPEVEIPHLKARSLSWVSLRVVGRVSAIHGVLLKSKLGGNETRGRVARPRGHARLLLM